MLVLLPLLMYAILHHNRVQHYLAGYLTSHLSSELQTDIVVGGVDFRLFRSVVLTDVVVNDQQGEQLLSVERMGLKLGRISIGQRLLGIDELHFDHSSLNIYRRENEQEYNFGFLVEYFSNLESSGAPIGRWDVKCIGLKISGAEFRFRDHNIEQRDHGFDPGNFYIRDLHLAVHDILLHDHVLYFNLDYLFYEESSGFIVHYISGDFTIGPHQSTIDRFIFRSPNSDLRVDLAVNYPSLESVETLIDGLEYQLNIRALPLDLADLGHFIPSVYGLDDTLHIEGLFEGTRDVLTAKQVKLTHGENTHFHGSFNLSGLMQWPDTHLYFKVEELYSHAASLREIRFSEAFDRQIPDIPDYFDNLGNISFAGELIGTVNNFLAEGSVQTGIGRLYSDVTMFRDSADAPYHYSGNLTADQFDLGRLFGRSKLLGKVSMQTRVEGTGFTTDMLDVHLAGDVESVEILENTYYNLDLAGDVLHRKFSGYFLLDDPDIYLDFHGTLDFEQDMPVFDFEARIDKANLSRINVFKRDTLFDSVLSANVKLNAKIRSLDEMEGELALRDIVYSEIPPEGHPGLENDIKTYTTGEIIVNNTVWSKNNQHLRIRSDFVDADVHGLIHFDRLISDVQEFGYVFLPALDARQEKHVANNDQNQDLRFDIRLKDTRELTGLFFPSVEIADGTWLNGSFNGSLSQLKMNGHSDLFSLMGRQFVGLDMSGQSTGRHYELLLESDRFMFSDSLYVDSFHLSTLLGDDMLELFMHWEGNGQDLDNGGEIKGQGRFYERNHFDFEFTAAHIQVNGDLWRINVDNKIIADKDRLEIVGLKAFHEDQFVMAEGTLSADPGDRMVLSFSNFDFAYSSILLGEKNFIFGGMMDGYVSFTGLYQPPSIGTEIHIEDFSFNRIHLGDFTLQSVWDVEKQAFIVDGEITDRSQGEVIRPVVVSGNIFAGDHGQHFDLDLDLEQKKMSVWAPYLASFATEFNGLASGNLRLEGPLNRPELSGHAMVADGHVFIPYLNVGFDFDHPVEFVHNALLFDGVLLRDSLGNTADFSGAVFHDVFKDFELDIRIRPNESIVFNTTAAHNSMYYGTGFVTGMAHLHGPVNDVVMDISARTNRGTRVILPLNYTGELRESHFISFVSRDDADNGQAFVPPELPGLITLNFDLEVTPDAELQLMFDTQFGDIIRGRGEGNLRLEVSPEGAFNIYGDYVIVDGEYFFNLQNIINKRFRIEQGGTIRWTGDLNDADVDLRAAYRLRTSLYDLFVGEGIDPEVSEVYHRRIPVETILVLEDKLFNPNISFEIVVPGGDEYIREMIERVITTDQEMNRQVFSLLVLNRFMPTTTDQYNTALGYGVGTTSSELLSNQMSNWLSQISSDFDIGINYRPGDEISSQEVELALSTQLFDNRVIIDGNFGVAGNQTATGQSIQGTNQIIGDVNVEVLITPEGKLRVKAFNRSNTFDIINFDAPYTQGIGVFYRKEFDRLDELFRRQVRGNGSGDAQQQD